MQLDAIYFWISKENQGDNSTSTKLRKTREQSWEQWKQAGGKSDEIFTSRVKDNYLYELSTPANLETLKSATTDKFVLMCCGGTGIQGALREVVRVRCRGDEGALELASRVLAICTEVAAETYCCVPTVCVLGLSNYWE